MRGIAASLFVWCWLAAAMTAAACGNRAPVQEQHAPGQDDVPLLRGAEAAAESPTPAVKREGTSPLPARTKATPSSSPSPWAVEPAIAPPTYETIDIGDDQLRNAAPHETRASVPVDFLRRDRSDFAEPVSGEALRYGAFGEIGHAAYQLPDVGATPVSQMVRAARPAGRSRGRSKFPVSEISWAGLAVLGFLLARQLLRSFRRSSSQQTGTI
jgi:hypothetical protein